ncbi:hypothetical protein CBI35_06290 [Pantoea sp. AV62]|nr:hypothetical protein HA39_00345 [Pantoea brenneri]OXM25635.1 hypothetical protein CBI35_06290 [Pantoea sp. AV62]
MKPRISGKNRGKLGGIIVCQTVKKRNSQQETVIFDQMVKNSESDRKRSQQITKNKTSERNFIREDYFL